MIIAIDGPAASGKSTVAKILAGCLGYLYIDTGAMYRALTFKALKEDVDLNNERVLAKFAKQINIQFMQDNKGIVRVLLDGEEVTYAIRDKEVTNSVSLVSAHKDVRKFMAVKQRALCKHCNVIIEGRDIGTVVAPFADKKFYLDADISARTKRRLEESEKDIKKRDALDSTRKHSPLTIANDAIYIDTTDMTVDEVCSSIAYFVLS